MSSTFSLNHPLRSIFWPREKNALKDSLLVLAGIIILALSAQISIPLQPVPLTFQSATVLLIGLVYGARLGAEVVSAYLIAGACGLPVFAEIPSSFHFFFGPTGGYLLGFLPAVIVTGWLSERGWASRRFTSFLAALIGAAVIFFFGVGVLSRFVGWDKAILLGLKPFVLTEAAKLILVALFVPKFWKKI